MGDDHLLYIEHPINRKGHARAVTHLSDKSVIHCVRAGSPSCGGDVAVYVLDINQPSLPTSFNLFLMSVSVFMALSTVFHSINFPENSSPSHSVLPALFLPYWSFQIRISL